MELNRNYHDLRAKDIVMLNHWYCVSHYTLLHVCATNQNAERYPQAVHSFCKGLQLSCLLPNFTTNLQVEDVTSIYGPVVPGWTGAVSYKITVQYSQVTEQQR